MSSLTLRALRSLHLHLLENAQMDAEQANVEREVEKLETAKAELERERDLLREEHERLKKDEALLEEVEGELKTQKVSLDRERRRLSDQARVKQALLDGVGKESALGQEVEAENGLRSSRLFPTLLIGGPTRSSQSCWSLRNLPEKQRELRMQRREQDDSQSFQLSKAENGEEEEEGVCSSGSLHVGGTVYPCSTDQGSARCQPSGSLSAEPTGVLSLSKGLGAERTSLVLKSAEMFLGLSSDRDFDVEGCTARGLNLAEEKPIETTAHAETGKESLAEPCTAPDALLGVAREGRLIRAEGEVGPCVLHSRVSCGTYGMRRRTCSTGEMSGLRETGLVTGCMQGCSCSKGSLADQLSRVLEQEGAVVALIRRAISQHKAVLARCDRASALYDSLLAHRDVVTAQYNRVLLLKRQIIDEMKAFKAERDNLFTL